MKIKNNPSLTDVKRKANEDRKVRSPNILYLHVEEPDK